MENKEEKLKESLKQMIKLAERYINTSTNFGQIGSLNESYIKTEGFEQIQKAKELLTL